MRERAAAALLLVVVAFTNYYFQGSGTLQRQTPASRTTSGPKRTSAHLRNGQGGRVTENEYREQMCVDEPSFDCAMSNFFDGEPPEDTQYMIATLPDPKHTHLALFFDRLAEALQQSAADNYYAFDKAWLPWSNTSDSLAAESSASNGGKENGLTDKRTSMRLFENRKSNHQKAEYRIVGDEMVMPNDRETEPGLLIFHKKMLEKPSYLVMLLVGERPTSGINKIQFERAFQVLQNHRPAKDQGFVDIVGPSFSGSFRSLDVMLKLALDQWPKLSEPKPRYTFRIHGGVAMSDSDINWFRTESQTAAQCNKESDAACNKSLFLSFKGTERFARHSFTDFVTKHLHYQCQDVALLTEDETAFGAASADKEPPCDSEILTVYFPRGISNLRSSYQEDLSLAEPNADKTPRTTLRNDLRTTGSDDDTVPTFAPRQVSLSQEAILQEIVRALRWRKSKFVILRATDGMDALFLAGRLRANYPEGRLVTISQDLLFRRDVDDAAFRGVLALSTYPVHPEWTESENPGYVHRIFPFSEAQATYCASYYLLRLRDVSKGQAQNSFDSPFCIPGSGKASIVQHEKQAVSAGNSPSSGDQYDGLQVSPGASKGTVVDQLAPAPLWLEVVGRDGYTGLSIIVPAYEKAAAFPPLPQPGAQEKKGGNSNQLLVLLLAIATISLAYFTWFGTVIGGAGVTSAVSQRLAMLPSEHRSVLMALLFSALSLCMFVLGVSWPVLLVMAAILTLSCCLNAYICNQVRGLVLAAVIFTLMIALGTILYYAIVRTGSSSSDQWTKAMFLFRLGHLSTGVSPAMPFLMLFGALVWWTWHAIKIRSLMDLRRPVLPRGLGVNLPSQDRYGAAAEGRVLTVGPAFLIVTAVVIIGSRINRFELQSLEGRTFDLIYTCLLVGMSLLMMNAVLLAWNSWQCLSGLLTDLDRTPLRYQFRKIKGFSWQRLWGLAGDISFAYKPLGRAMLAFRRLSSTLPETSGIAKRLRDASSPAEEIRSWFYQHLNPTDAPVDVTLAKQEKTHRTPKWLESARTGLKEKMRNNEMAVWHLSQLETDLAALASIVYLGVLKRYWEQDQRFVTHDPAKLEENEHPADGLAKLVGATQSETERDWAEEFIALLYISFVLRVLFRIRWLVISAIGIFVFLLFSVTSYPFEPKSTIVAGFVFLFGVIAVIIGIIFGQMHRDATLSHLTNTEPGQLGTEFWVRMLALGGIPIFTLISSQVPQLNRVLFFWVKPILEGAH